MSPGSPSSKQSPPASPLHMPAAAPASQKRATVTTDLPELAPELVDKYRLLAEVGKGGFATVYKAEGLNMEGAKARPFAVKVVDFEASAAKSESSDPDGHKDQVRTMTISEVDIMSRASNENIIKLHEVAEHSNQMWMVLEFMGGGDLEGHVKHYRGLTESTAAHIFKQVCSAVDYCHNVLEVVHRDLKPENILIYEPATSRDDMLSVKLADFGLATAYESTKVVKLFCGTPYFFAPELLKDSGYSRAVDCWSLGVILYFILSSKLPFMSKDKEELKSLICSGVYAYPATEWEGTSESSQDLIRRLLNTNALQRYSVKEALDHPWMHGETTIDTLAPTVFDMLRVESVTTMDS